MTKLYIKGVYAVMDALEALVSMGIAPVLVSKSVTGKILVNFENGYIRDGCFFRGGIWLWKHRARGSQGLC